MGISLFPVVTLLTQFNTKLLEQLKYVLKRTINWIKCQSKKSTERQNQYLDCLIDQSFQEEDRLFLSFEDETQGTSYKRYYFPTVEIKNCDLILMDKTLLINQ